MTTAIIAREKSILLVLPKVNWKTIYYFTVCSALIVFFVSIIFYVFCINELTSGSYIIKNYGKEINSLSDQNAKLQMGFAQSSFLGQVQEKAQLMDFEKIKNIKYIQVIDSSLAKK